MAISLIGAHGFGGTSLPSIAVQPGDFLVYKLAIRNNAAVDRLNSFGLDGASTATIGAVTVPINQFGIPLNDGQFALAYARVTGAGNLLASVSLSGGQPNLGASVWRGVHTDSPIVGTPTYATATTGTTFPRGAVTPSQAGDVVIGFTGSQNAQGIGASWTETTDWDFLLEAASGDWNERIRAEYIVAPNTSALSGGHSGPNDTSWSAANLILRAAPEIIPGTIVARGLYL